MKNKGGSIKKSIDAAYLEFEKEPMDDYYKSTIAGYIPRLRVKRIIEDIGDIKNKKILDIGCEAGYISLRLMKKEGDVFGIDVCEPALKKYFMRTGKTGVLGIAQKMPFRNEAFDAVVCSEAIEHMPDLDSVFMEIQRVTKEKGRIIITFPNEGMRKRIYPIVKLFGINADVEKDVTLFEYNKKDIIEKSRKYFKVIKTYTIPLFFPLTNIVVCKNGK